MNDNKIVKILGKEMAEVVNKPCFLIFRCVGQECVKKPEIERTKILVPTIDVFLEDTPLQQERIDKFENTELSDMFYDFEKKTFLQYKDVNMRRTNLSYTNKEFVWLCKGCKWERLKKFWGSETKLKPIKLINGV